MGIDIKDIPKIDDKEFSITLNAFFVVRWTDKRMIIDQHKMKHIFKKGKLKKSSMFLATKRAALVILNSFYPPARLVRTNSDDTFSDGSMHPKKVG